MEGLAAEDFVQDGVDVAVAEFDERIHLAGRARLTGEKFLKLLSPGLLIKSEPAFQFPEYQVNVHGLEMVGNQLRNHGGEVKLLKYLVIPYPADYQVI